MSKTFKLYFKEDWFNKGDVFITEGYINHAVVISTPKSRWFLKLLEIISFGFYKAPIYYKCKIIK